MTEQSSKYLTDILMAIELIEDFTKDINSFTDYERDRKSQSAVERQLVIIGEAVNQFQKLEPAIAIEHDRQILPLYQGNYKPSPPFNRSHDSNTSLLVRYSPNCLISFSFKTRNVSPGKSGPYTSCGSKM